MIKKKFEIKRGHLYYKEEMEFKSTMHLLYWRLYMKKRGCTVKEFQN